MCLIYEAEKNGSNKMPFEHLYAAESAELVFRRKKMSKTTFTYAHNRD